MKKASVSLLMVFLAAMVGCANMGSLDTPEKQFLGARGELNILIEQYVMIQDDVPMPLHLKIKSYFENADLILDMWQTNINKDIDFATDYRAWINIKSQILQTLKEIYDE